MAPIRLRRFAEKPYLIASRWRARLPSQNFIKGTKFARPVWASRVRSLHNFTSKVQKLLPFDENILVHA